MNNNEIFLQLSYREKQVLELLLKGLSVSQIALKYTLKCNTISTVKKNILTKFNVKNIVQLIYLLEDIGINISKIENINSFNSYNQNEESQSSSINVKNSDMFFELIKISKKDYIIEINKEGVKSIYRKIQ